MAEFVKYTNPSAYKIEKDSITAHLKIPPHSIEAEQAILGSLLLDKLAWDRISELVQEKDFYRANHRSLFTVLTALAYADVPLDLVTVLDRLKSENKLDEVGGEAYLYELAKNTPSTVNVVAYAQIVRQRSLLRQLIQASTEIADSAFNPEGRETDELVDLAESKIFQIAEQRVKESGPEHITTAITEAMVRLDELANSNTPLTGLATGFTDFDMMTAGLQAAELIIIAGRPSMGKTAFAMNIVEHVTIKTQRPVLVFSMEMPGSALAMRLLSSWSRVNQLDLRIGKLDDKDWDRVKPASIQFMSSKLFIDDTPNLTPLEMRSRARRLAREQGDLALIVVDYLQLMQVPSLRDNRVAEISEISRSLKALARELNVPVVALSQLNRSLEQRSDKRPIMSDLRESGAIEQDADLIGFIYRDEVYNKESPDKGTAELIVGKQRNGPIGTVKLTFEGNFTRFSNHLAATYGYGEN